MWDHHGTSTGIPVVICRRRLRLDGHACVRNALRWAVGLMLAFNTSGCGRQPAPTGEQSNALNQRIGELQSQIRSVEQAIARLDSNESCDEALARAREQMESGDYGGAHDFLLAAMRLDPSQPVVFKCALQFVRVAAESEHAEHLELADGMLARADALIPFQPGENIASARDEYRTLARELAESLPRQEPPASNQPIDTLAADIEWAKTADLPPELASLVLDQLRVEFETLAVQTVRAGPAATPDLLEKMGELKTKLDEAERGILTGEYEGLHQRVGEWTARTDAELKAHDRDGQSDLLSARKRIRELITDGYDLRADCVSYALLGIEAASHDQRAIDRRNALLERSSEWIDNQRALTAILDAEANTEASKSIDVLKRLAEHDSQRLAPYIAQRYEEAWRKWFDELDAHDDKVEATKLRVMRGGSP